MAEVVSVFIITQIFRLIKWKCQWEGTFLNNLLGVRLDFLTISEEGVSPGI